MDDPVSDLAQRAGGIAVVVVGGVQVERGIVPRLRAIDLLGRDLVRRLRDEDGEARVARGLHPFVDAVGLGPLQLEPFPEGLERIRELADQLLQGALLHLEVVGVEDLLGDRLVVARLGLERVDDRGGADLEVALGLRELLRDRALLGVGKGDVVLREQHVEVGLRHAHDQVLAGRRERRLGLHDLLFRLRDRDPVLHPEEGLRERQVVAARGVIEVVRPVALVVVPVGPGRARDVGQVPRARLRQALDVRLVLGTGRLVDGVARERVAVDADQVRGMGGQGEARGGEEGSEAFGFHFGFPFVVRLRFDAVGGGRGFRRRRRQ